MSIRERRIGFYAIEFEDKNEHFFNLELFKKLLSYIDRQTGIDRVIRNEKTNKAVDVQMIKYEDANPKYIQITFKSCKYNHSPNYMSSVDGTERPSQKKKNEGEKELTHMMVNLCVDEALILLEERRGGVSISDLVRYLNKNFDRLKKEKTYLDDISENIRISYSIIPSNEFMEQVDNCERIIMAELYTDREIVGTGYLGLAKLDDSIQENVIVTIKAKRAGSLAKNMVKDAFNGIATSGSKVKRIRLRAKNSENFNLILDSAICKKEKKLFVELNNDGTVNSFSIFLKMKELMEELDERG